MKKTLCLLVVFTFLLVLLGGCSNKETETMTSRANSITEEDSKEDKEYKNRVDRRMKELFDLWSQDNYFSGYILVGTDNELIYTGGCGYADYEKKLEINEYTKFKVGSIGKQFAATAIMQLQEKGLLSVNDKLSKYIPEFPYSDKITIHHLLTHGSGLERDASTYDMRHYIPGEDKKLATGEKRPEDLELMFNPGEGYSYSNVGYILLGMIVEGVSGETLDVYYRKNLLEPLEMSNTGFLTPGAKVDNFAVGYTNGEQTLTFPDQYLFRADQEDAAGFYSCAADLYKWNRALHSGKLIKPETQDLMLTKHNGNYGYGWNIYGDPPQPISYVHDGQSIGYTNKLIKTSEDISIIMLSNYDVIELDYVLDNIIPIIVDED